MQKSFITLLFTLVFAFPLIASGMYSNVPNITLYASQGQENTDTHFKEWAYRIQWDNSECIPGIKQDYYLYKSEQNNFSSKKTSSFVPTVEIPDNELLKEKNKAQEQKFLDDIQKKITACSKLLDYHGAKTKNVFVDLEQITGKDRRQKRKVVIEAYYKLCCQNENLPPIVIYCKSLPKLDRSIKQHIALTPEQKNRRFTRKLCFFVPAGLLLLMLIGNNLDNF